MRPNSFLREYREKKKKMGDGTWELSVTQKLEPVLRRTLHQDISLIIEFFFLFQTNLAFKLNLV